MGERLSRVVLYGVPVATVAVVAFALFVVGAPEPARGARVWGGPTDGVSVLAWRIQLVTETGGLVVPARGGELGVEVKLDDGRMVAGRASVDAYGNAYVHLPLKRPANGPLDVRVREGARPLARGRVMLSRAKWSAGATRRGGVMRASRRGALRVEVAPMRGVFAVPFEDPLLVRVLESDKPVEGARLVATGDGVRIESQRVETDAAGRAVIRVAPERFVAALRLRAERGEQRGEWYATLPLVQGALHGELFDGKLRVRSPIERSTAFFSIVSEKGRLRGGTVSLEADGRGGAVGETTLGAELPTGQVWAVVSSEPDLDSPGAVGWPLRVQLEPRSTFTVGDTLLLDGLALGRARQRDRRRSARWLAGLFSAAALGLVALTLVFRVRRSGRVLGQHLRAQGVEQRRGRVTNLLWLLVALVCIALGFATVALVAMYDIG